MKEIYVRTYTRPFSTTTATNAHSAWGVFVAAFLMIIAIPISARGSDDSRAAAPPAAKTSRDRALPALYSVSGLQKLITEQKEKARKTEEAKEKRATSSKRQAARFARGLKSKIKNQKSKIVVTRPTTKRLTDDDELAGTDALEALLQYTRQRAFPHDTINWAAYPRAVARRERMPAANLSGRSGIGVQDLGGTWSFMGPTNLPPPYRIYYGVGATSGRVSALAYDNSNSAVAYLGAAGGGLWKTADAGAHWTPLSDGWQSNQVSCITIDPTNTNTIYVGTGDFDGSGGYGFGIMKSTNAGATWTNQAAAETANNSVSSILVDPDNPNIVTAAAGKGRYYYGEIWQSTNGGLTWGAVLTTGSPWSDLHMSAPDNANNRYYYASGGGGGAGQLWRSPDRGATWTQLNPPTINASTLECATSKTKNSTVYVISPLDQLIWRSDSAGDDGTWVDITGTIPGGYNWSQYWYDCQLTTSTRLVGGIPTDVLYNGLITVSQSPSGDGTWVDVGKTYTFSAHTHNDQHSMAIDPNDPNKALIGNDGGVYGFSYDPSTGATTFDATLSKTLGITQFYHIDAHPTNPNMMLGGAQDNATPVSTGDIANWVNRGGGDGGGVAINPNNPLVQYTTSQFLGISKTADGWVTQTGDSTVNASTDRLPFIGQIYLDPSNPDLLYAGTNYLWRYDAAANVWTGHVGSQQLSTTGTVQAIAVAPTDGTRIYTGSDDGELWMSTDNGATWARIDSGTVSLPTAAITSIIVDPLNPNKITAGLSGYGTPHLWRCNNTVAGSRTWTNISGTTSPLPDIPVNAIALDLDDPGNVVYVATDIGVFCTSNGGPVWQNATQPLGLPNVQVNDIKAIEGTRSLYAGTYGRGIWRISLPAKGVFSALSLSPNSIKTATTSTGTVTLNAAAPAGGLLVNLSSSKTAVATVPASITIPAGSLSGTFTATGNAVSVPSDTYITATNSTFYKRVRLRISPYVLTGLTVLPTSVNAGTSSTGTVTIDSPAPAGGVTVALSSNNAAATVPASVTVAAGSTTATFTINTSFVDPDLTVAITGTLNGSSKSANLLIKSTAPALVSVTATPASLAGGAACTGKVTLTVAATANSTVTLTSSNTAILTVPASATVLTGATTQTFAVTTVPVKAKVVVTITAKYKTVTKTVNVTVNPPAITSVKLNPTSVYGGVGSTGTVALTGAVATGAGAYAVTLTSDNAAASVPASVSVPVGASTATFAITTKAVAASTIATITGKNGTLTKTAKLTVKPPVLSAVSLSPTSVKGGTSSTGTVTLTGIAPTGGISVTLSSSLAGAHVPATVTVLAGATTATFTVTTTTVTATAKSTISATAATVKKTAVLTITP